MYRRTAEVALTGRTDDRLTLPLHRGDASEKTAGKTAIRRQFKHYNCVLLNAATPADKKGNERQSASFTIISPPAPPALKVKKSAVPVLQTVHAVQ